MLNSARATNAAGRHHRSRALESIHPVTRQMRAVMTGMLAILVLCLYGLAFGQSPDRTPRPLPTGVSISASISPSNPVEGEYFTYVVAVRGNAGVQQWRYPGWSQVPGVIPHDGPHRTDAMAGGMVQQTRYFRLLANRAGDVRIPPAEILINGYWYQTNPVEFTVQTAPPDPSGIDGVISGRSSTMPGVNQELRGNYFARAEFPRQAFRGQIVPITIYVYRHSTMLPFGSYDIARAPSGNDFQFPEPDRGPSGRQMLDWEEVEVSDRDFFRAPLYTFYAVPTREGTLRLTPPLLRVFVQSHDRRRAHPLFDDFFGMRSAQTVDIELPLRPIDMVVEALPEKPREAAAQIVGNINSRVSVDREELTRRELVTLRVEIAGEAHLGMLRTPEIPGLHGLTLLDEKSETLSVIEDGKFIAKRTFEYVYQATDEGTVEVPSLAFAVFDPRTGQQQLQRSTPIALKVHPSQGQAVLLSGDTNAGDTAGSRTGARELGRDVAYIDTTPLTAAALQRHTPFYGKPWFWFLQTLPFAFAFLYGILAIRNRRRGEETAEQRARRGRKAAENALREARRQIETAERDAFYAALRRGVMEYAAALLGRSAKGLTAEEAVESLLGQERSGEACRALEKLLQRLDAVRYSPGADTADTRREAIENAEQVLTGLDAPKEAHAA